MTMKFDFSQDEIERFFVERYNHPHPRVQRRLEAFYLKSQGVTHKQICELLRVSKVSLNKWLHLYAEKGIEGLKQLGYKGRKGSFRAHQKTIEEHFRSHPPRTIPEACRVLKELTGVERGKTAVRHFLLSIGMAYRKTGIVPGKADREAQEQFKKKSSIQS